MPLRGLATLPALRPLAALIFVPARIEDRTTTPALVVMFFKLARIGDRTSTPTCIAMLACMAQGVCLLVSGGLALYYKLRYSITIARPPVEYSIGQGIGWRSSG